MALRIYTARSDLSRTVFQAFESKDILALKMAHDFPDQGDAKFLAKGGVAFKTWSVQDYVDLWNKLTPPVKITLLGSKEFGVQSKLTPAGRKLPNVSVSYDNGV